jgi:hypothetical protein
MKQYLDNLNTLNGIEALGDISYVTYSEMFNYVPGTRETAAGWRETGNYLRSKVFIYISSSLL